MLTFLFSTGTVALYIKYGYILKQFPVLTWNTDGIRIPIRIRQYRNGSEDPDPYRNPKDPLLLPAPKMDFDLIEIFQAKQGSKCQISNFGGQST
jgi:hypothetical protein